MREWLRRLRFLGRARRFDDDLRAELAFHVEMRARELEREGLSTDDAGRQARRDVGPALQIREASRDVWVFRWLDYLTQDVRYALRAFRRQPGFTAAVVGTLALGIGANTAMFSVVDTLLLRPPPFEDPGRLVLIHASRPAQQQAQLPLSYPNFVDLRARNHAFAALSAWTMGEMTLIGRGTPEQVQFAMTTANLFDLLGVTPRVGRAFRADEDRPGTPPVVLISHSLWTRRFARDPNVVGTAMNLDGEPHTIIGVTPEGFRFASYPHETELWLPFGLDKFTDRKYARGLSTLLAIGRLRPDVTVEQAQTDVGNVAAALEREFPDNNRARLMFAVPLETKAAAHIRWALAALSAGVVLVLLIACANVVSLLLGRASSRQHELAVRSVLGGSRRRIGAQLLVEHSVLALAAGLGALVVAWGARGLLIRLPYNTADYFTPWVAPLADAGLSGRTLIFTLGASVAVGSLVGVLPALQTPATDQAALSGGGARVTGQRRTMRLRSGLVVSEIAMAVVLLAAMGLMLTGVVRLLRVDPGFSSEGVSAMDLALPASKYPSGGQVVTFYSELLARIRQVSGVSSAGAVENLPFSGLDSDTGLLFEGQTIPTPDKRPRAHYRAVTDGYFETMGIPIRAGRAFTARIDRSDAPIVAAVNETAARQWFSDGRTLGRRVALDFEAMRFFRDRPPVFDLPLGLREIVGVVRDVRHSALNEEAGAELYVPHSQRGVRKMTVVVRSAMASSAVFAAVRKIIVDLDPDQPVASATTLSDLIAASTTRPRFNTTLITAFGVLALALAAIGIYGVMSYFVALRQRDIGIHVAIGATPGDVFRLVTRPMLVLGSAGMAIGFAGVMAIGPGLSRLLVGVKPRDPVVFGAVAGVVVLTVAAATLVPALRALRIDPARALRNQT